MSNGSSALMVDLSRMIASAQATTQAINNLNQTVNSLNATVTALGTTISSAIPGVPSGATPVAASSYASGTTLTCSFLSVSGLTNYITGFALTGTGATSATAVLVTISGTVVSLYFTYCVVAGVTTQNTPLIVNFPTPVPASAPGSAISITVPSAGAGNTYTAVTIYGFTG